MSVPTGLEEGGVCAPSNAQVCVIFCPPAERDTDVKCRHGDVRYLGLFIRSGFLSRFLPNSSLRQHGPSQNDTCSAMKCVIFTLVVNI